MEVIPKVRGEIGSGKEQTHLIVWLVFSEPRCSKVSQSCSSATAQIVVKMCRLLHCVHT
jgi:hypothetical protein